MGPSKAPGPCAATHEDFGHFSGILPTLAFLISCMAGLGVIPLSLGGVNVAPLGKLKKDPALFAPEGPISSICVLIKIDKAAVSKRISREME